MYAWNRGAWPGFSKKKGGGGGVTLCQTEGIYQFSPSGCRLFSLKWLKKGGGGGSRAPQTLLPLSYALEQSSKASIGRMLIFNCFWRDWSRGESLV